MIKYFMLVLILVSTSSKGQNQNSDQKDPIESLREKEMKSTEKNTAGLGEMVSVISFEVKTNNKKDFENGLIPYASIENAKREIPDLDKKDEVVIKENSIKIIIT